VLERPSRGLAEGAADHLARLSTGPRGIAGHRRSESRHVQPGTKDRSFANHFDDECLREYPLSNGEILGLVSF
jgi:hypothetical protein